MAAPDPHTPRTSAEPAGLGAFVSDLFDNTSLLIRQEVALAKAEVGKKVSSLTKDALMLVIGGFVAYTGLLVLIAALVLGLATVWPAWAAALVVGVVIAGVGVALLFAGLKHLQNLSAAPERTVQSVGDTVQMIKEKV